MPGFWDDPMFTSPTNTPTVTRYPGTDFGLLPPWAYNTPWPPATATTPSLPPTAAAPPPRPAAPPLPIPRPPLLLAPPAPPPNAVSAAPPSVPPNMGAGLNNPLTNHAATLMALGAGIAQGGIGRGLAMASAAAENERNRQLQQMSLLRSYKALTDSGVPQQEAIAAVSNPSLMRTLAARYLGARARSNAPASASAAPPPNAPLPSSAASQSAATAPLSAATSLADARRAPDGNLYVRDAGRPGKYLAVRYG